MRTPVRIVRAHQHLWKTASYELWKLPVSVLGEPHDRLTARELEIGTEPLRESVHQDENQCGERDDPLISKDEN
jgi:hypothetical protein